MPLVGEFHTNFWASTDTNVAAPSTVVSGDYYYPKWQHHATTFYMATPWGVAWLAGVRLARLGVLALIRAWRWVKDVTGLIRWAVRLDRRSRHLLQTFRPLKLDREGNAVLVRVAEALAHPCYPLAQSCVRKVATTIHFNRPEAWRDLSRTIKNSQGEAENMFRHMEACRLLRANAVLSTVSNPHANLFVELAYHGFAAKVST